MSADASGLRRKVDRYLDNLAAGAAAEHLKLIDKDVPVDTRTLKDVGHITKVGKRKWRIWYPADYASYTDTGSRPHVIRPVRAQALRFQIGGRTVFAARVNHPGTVGTRWFSGKINRTDWRRSVLRAKARVGGRALA